MDLEKLKSELTQKTVIYNENVLVAIREKQLESVDGYIFPTPDLIGRDTKSKH